jgi:perosamine synthetase
MKNKIEIKYPVNVFEISTNDIDSVVNCLNDGWISGESPIIEEFENKFAEKTGTENAIAVSNGSVALDLAFYLIGLKSGDEVILPTFTIASCLFPILRSGATPVFVDCDLDTWNMKSEDVIKKISPKTKAVLIVHTYGLAVDMKDILQECKKLNIKVIEDCAEAHGLKYGDKYCGSFGDISTFSFYANKAITTGEGGMLLIKDRNLANKARKIRNLSFESGRRFVHSELGWNYRLSSIQAALGISQLKKLDSNLENKSKAAQRYRKNLNQIKGIKWQPLSSELSNNCFWVNALVLDPEIFGSSEEVAHKLLEAGIQTRPFFFPLHLQPIYVNKFPKKEIYSNSEYISKHGIYLPSGNGLTLKMVDEISDIFVSLFANKDFRKP